MTLLLEFTFNLFDGLRDFQLEAQTDTIMCNTAIMQKLTSQTNTTATTKQHATT